MSTNPYATADLGRIIDLSLRNSEQFIKDAEELIRTGSFGHAIAFLVSSIEESGKALILFSSMQTKKTVSPKIIKRHVIKTRSAGLFDLFRDIILPVHEEYFPKIIETIEKYGTDDLQAIADELYSYYSQLLDRRTNELEGKRRDTEFKHLEEKLDYYKRLEDYRLNGLYVGLKDDGSISSPSMFDRTNAEKLLAEACRILWIIKTAIKDLVMVPDELKKAFDKARYIESRKGVKR